MLAYFKDAANRRHERVGGQVHAIKVGGGRAPVFVLVGALSGIVVVKKGKAVTGIE